MTTEGTTRPYPRPDKDWIVKNHLIGSKASEHEARFGTLKRNDKQTFGCGMELARAIYETHLKSLNDRLRAVEEAGIALDRIIVLAQTCATTYLVPDGISKDEFVNEVIGILDGPEQHSAQDGWRSLVTTQPNKTT